MKPLSIRKSLAGAHILLTGASGFLGKFWLYQLLDTLPELGRMTILLRPKRGRSALARFEAMLGSSYLFKPLHEKHGAAFAELVASRVEVVEGQLDAAQLGLADDVARRLHGSLDVLVNCGGLTDFNPDLQAAFSTNVEGTLHAADFVERCDHAALLHVSTCFVAGTRQGLIDESIADGETPLGKSLDVEREVLRIKDEIRCLERELESDDGGNSRARRTVLEKRLRREFTERGRERGRGLGWPNIYTFTKSLAEQLLARRSSGLDFTVFRPAIVESSLRYPFAGWNEGFNGSGPLAYLLGTWFRHFPARPGNPFDVVPVDLCCNFLTIITAALHERCHAPLYQCGTSDNNRLTIDRACELTALSHRRHYRATGKSMLERAVLSRWEAIPTEGKPLLAIDNLRALARSAGKVLKKPPAWLPAPFKEKSMLLGALSEHADRQLKPVEKVLEAYRPFTQENRQIFRCQAINGHDVLEPEYRYRPEEIDWHEYWLDIHMPALRRWCFPQLKNEPIETYQPAQPFRLPRATPIASGARNGGA